MQGAAEGPFLRRVGVPKPPLPVARPAVGRHADALQHLRASFDQRDIRVGSGRGVEIESGPVQVARCPVHGVAPREGRPEAFEALALRLCESLYLGRQLMIIDADNDDGHLGARPAPLLLQFVNVLPDGRAAGRAVGLGFVGPLQNSEENAEDPPQDDARPVVQAAVLHGQDPDVNLDVHELQVHGGHQRRCAARPLERVKFVRQHGEQCALVRVHASRASVLTHRGQPGGAGLPPVKFDQRPAARRLCSSAPAEGAVLPQRHVIGARPAPVPARLERHRVLEISEARVAPGAARLRRRHRAPRASHSQVLAPACARACSCTVVLLLW